MVKKAIRTDAAPPPAANYSQAVRKGNILQIAGQVGIDPATKEIAGSTVESQTRQTFANLNAILAAAGSSLDDVLMLRVYLTDAGHFAEFNAVFAEFVTEPYAARTTVYVGLAPGLLVEIDALAVVED
ncbi:MAG TPA: Rid family detoxifying hydrolase [Pseudonocardiaceae bacterium]|jgi:reactive intermediate/imine deaminase|nr:Rid family detoxifying hydrolase [Pseudonocardiaceae bacterium]